jgi:hypothetical protein
MNKLFKVLSWTFVALGLISLIISFVLFFSESKYFEFGESFNLEVGNQFGGLLAGLVGIFFSGTGTFLVFLTFEQQRSQFLISQFENSFFNLLSHLQNIINQISGPVNLNNIHDGNVVGRKYLYYQIRELKEIINNRAISIMSDEGNQYKGLASHFLLYNNPDLKCPEPINESLLKSFIQEAYEDFYKNKYSFLGHYFRFVYHLIKFVDESDLLPQQKKKYIDLIQAQMTSDELGLLLFNGLGKIGNRKAFPLLESYDFLSNLDTRVLPYPGLIIRLYPKTNFKYKNYGS